MSLTSLPIRMHHDSLALVFEREWGTALLLVTTCDFYDGRFVALLRDINVVCDVVRCV